MAASISRRRMDPASLSMANLRTQRLFPLLAAFLSLALAAAATASANAPALHSDTAVSAAGYYQLKWSAPNGGTPVFELQEAPSARFNHIHPVYKGTDEASLLSGRRNGVYYYRVRIDAPSGAGPWSAPVKVTVEHQPLARAFLFFGIGAVVFLATLGLVVVGNLRGQKES